MELLDDYEKEEEFFDIKKGWQKGRTGYVVVEEMKKENNDRGPKGLYFDRHSKFGETPNHRYYSGNFGAEYLFGWKKGKKTGDTK